MTNSFLATCAIVTALLIAAIVIYVNPSVTIKNVSFGLDVILAAVFVTAIILPKNWWRKLH